MAKKLKTFKIITKSGKEHVCSAYSKKSILDYYLSEYPIKINITKKNVDTHINRTINE